MTRWEKHLHSMTVTDRIAAAKVKTDAVVNHLLWQIALRENNAIVLYSDVLSSQISGSRAVEAFKIFRSGLHLFEIIRLCTIWDKPAEAAESIPTIVELIDDTDVNAAFAHETQSKWLDPRDAGFSLEQHGTGRS